MRTTTTNITGQTIDPEIHEEKELQNYEEITIRCRCNNSPLHICLAKYYQKLKSEEEKKL